MAIQSVSKKVLLQLCVQFLKLSCRMFPLQRLTQSRLGPAQPPRLTVKNEYCHSGCRRRVLFRHSFIHVLNLKITVP